MYRVELTLWLRPRGPRPFWKLSPVQHDANGCSRSRAVHLGRHEIVLRWWWRRQ